MTSSPTGIDCGPTCAYAFDSATLVTLTATAAAGSTFISWTGCASTSADTCTVTMSAARTVTAEFTNGPVVTGLSPNTGHAGGMTLVKINGIRLTQGGRTCMFFVFFCAVTVHFGEAQGFVLFATPTSLEVISPPGTGSVDVVVTVAGVDSPKQPVDVYSYTG